MSPCLPYAFLQKREIRIGINCEEYLL